MTRYFNAYRSGQFNGTGPVLWLFSFYKADGSPASSLCVEEAEVGKTRENLLQQGFRPLCELREKQHDPR